ncbi:hypothetical protein [Falsiroseomonas sp.]|uniref:hypothetical protein n=1 Tax=Falsiroseomonas sp. TaxID=2870721 RepID=UPI003569A68A
MASPPPANAAAVVMPSAHIAVGGGARRGADSVLQVAEGTARMGERQVGQEALLYGFSLEEPAGAAGEGCSAAGAVSTPDVSKVSAFASASSGRSASLLARFLARQARARSVEVMGRGPIGGRPDRGIALLRFHDLPH